MSTPADAQATKFLKKGEHLYNLGDPCNTAFLIQSGVVQVYLPKGKGKTELYQVRAPQALGLECLLGIPTHTASALVLSDVKAILIPAKAAAAAMTGGPQLLRLFLKTCYEKEKVVLQELKSLKSGGDTSACPADSISKTFGAIYHTARYKGEEADGKVSISWDGFRQYAQRVFLEPPLRIENACNIFVKLGLAEYKMVPDETDPEAPPKIGAITFADLPFVEGFFEYYAHHFFKSSNTSILKVDDRCSKFLKALLSCTAEAPVDRGGVVNAVLTETLEKLNATLGTQKTDYLSLLESKGLFAKKTPSSSGGTLQFHRGEWEMTQRFWGILKEIERWNESGTVNIVEETVNPASAAGGCPECSKPFDGTPNFCPNCGYKFKTGKAA